MSKLGIGLAVLAGGGLLLAASRASAAESCPGMPPAPPGGLAIERVEWPSSPGGYTSWRLRSDVAASARQVVAKMLAVGAKPSSSGGMRDLAALVTAGRSSLSLHYLGCALDLWMYGGMQDPRTDPYIITRDGPGLWRVWARCDPGKGRRLVLDAVRAGAPSLQIEADVIDLTALMACHGLRRIPARGAAWSAIERDKSVYELLEWWHFEIGFPMGTRFGDELLRVHRARDVEGTPPWQYRDYAWNGRVFAAGAV